MHFDWQKNCGENGDDSNTLYDDGEVRGSRISAWKKISTNITYRTLRSENFNKNKMAT